MRRRSNRDQKTEERTAPPHHFSSRSGVWREPPGVNHDLRCFVEAAKGLLAVGARRVFLPLLRPPVIEKLSDVDKIEKLRFTYNDLISYSDHTSGGNQFGVDARRGVTDSSGRVFGTSNVYVADSSLFPTAPGVNPSWTIMALARHVATGISTRG